jgi:hypothetical protein
MILAIQKLGVNRPNFLSPLYGMRLKKSNLTPSLERGKNAVSSMDSGLGLLSAPPKGCGTIVLQLSRRIFLPASTPTHFNVHFRQYASLSQLRHPIALLASTGILTCYPSPTPVGLGLGTA